MRSDELQARLRRLVKERRQGLGWTADELERRLGWSAGSVNRIEDPDSQARLNFLDLLELLSTLRFDAKSIVDGLTAVGSEGVPANKEDPR